MPNEVKTELKTTFNNDFKEEAGLQDFDYSGNSKGLGDLIFEQWNLEELDRAFTEMESSTKNKFAKYFIEGGILEIEEMSIFLG